MSKKSGNFLLKLIIVVCLFVIIWFSCDIFDEKHKNGENVSNTISNEIISNSTFVKESNNVVKENTISEDNTEKENIEENKETPTVSSENIAMSREEKAIELVKKEWGGTEGVYFSNESMDQNGKYIVSVRDQKTTNLLAFFTVDVDSETVKKR